MMLARACVAAAVLSWLAVFMWLSSSAPIRWGMWPALTWLGLPIVVAFVLWGPE